MNNLHPEIGRLRIACESPLTDDARLLIEASQAALLDVYPPEEVFSLSPEELAAPNCQFLVARIEGKAVGCVALVDMVLYGEVKRLFLAPHARGRGVARALMRALEDVAAQSGVPVLKLETGFELASAVALYRALGYVACAPFGGIPDLGSNLFLEKALVARPA
jgi:putative acetyltransferase